jgi:protein disulfide-isomerase
MFTHLITASLVLVAGCASFVQAADWGTDLKAAKTEAANSKLPIIMDFTGSDWCGWCVRLKKEVFSTPEFSAWAKDKAVLLELDFPQAKAQTPAVKAQNEALQQEFQIQGYPTIVITDAQGKELGRLGYMKGGPGAWTAAADKIIAGGTK